MSDLVAGIGEFSTEADVNFLAARHCEDQNMIQAKINSQIDSLQETQKREYRDWLMKLLEEQAEEASSVTPPTPSPTHMQVFFSHLCGVGYFSRKNFNIDISTIICF